MITANWSAPYCSLFPCRSLVLRSACAICRRACRRSSSSSASYCLRQIAIVLLRSPPVGRRECFGGESTEGWCRKPMYASHQNNLFPENVWVSVFPPVAPLRSICFLVQRNISNFFCRGFISSLQAFLGSVSITRGGRWFDFPHKRWPISACYPHGKLYMRKLSIPPTGAQTLNQHIQHINAWLSTLRPAL